MPGDSSCVLNMLDFVLKMMDLSDHVLKASNFVLKMLDFVLKMMDFVPYNDKLYRSVRAPTQVSLSRSVFYEANEGSSIETDDS